MKGGEWQSLACEPAWDGNGTWDSFVAHSWQGDGGKRMLVVVNYSAQDGQCYLKLPFPEIQGRSVRLKDLLGDACYDRDGTELAGRGLYLDMPAWSYHIFHIEETP